MYRILVVDDEENIREVIKEYAEFEGHQVSEACDGMQAIEMVKNNDYDIIIMDVMMPRLDGYSACKEIRKIKQIPVLMLSARGEEYDKLFGFEIGIDDYVVKPFSPKEVMARVNAIVKRNQGAKQAPAAPAPETVKFGGLEINFTSRDVYIDGVKANLTRRSTTFCSISCAIRTSRSQETSSSRKSGATISSETTAPLTPTSKCSETTSVRIATIL